MPTKMSAGRAAPVQPKVGPSRAVDPPTRCRVGIVCHGDATGKDLSFHRLRINGVVRPMLCCDGCAEGREAE